MPYTRAIFEPEEHRPEPFLGDRVALPELEGFSERMRQMLENPVLSFDQAAEFMALSGWFAPGYDEKLKPAHWGVFTARTLEAMFFRLYDLTQEQPRWGRKEEGPVDRVQVFCETRSMHNLARDLVVYVHRAPDGDHDQDDGAAEVKKPATTREHLTKEDDGNERVRAFWSPMEVAMVINALSAWDALRFTNEKDAHGNHRRFTVDVALGREKGVLTAMGALFGPAFLARAQAQHLHEDSAAAQPSKPTARL